MKRARNNYFANCKAIDLVKGDDKTYSEFHAYLLKLLIV